MDYSFKDGWYECHDIDIRKTFFLKDNWDVQIQTGEFKGESISVLHYKVKEKVPMVFKQPNLIYSVTL